MTCVLQPLPHRSLQLGLVGEAARLYADEWIVSITDITPLAHTIHAMCGMETWTWPGDSYPMNARTPSTTGPWLIRTNEPGSAD